MKTTPLIFRLWPALALLLILLPPAHAQSSSWMDTSGINFFVNHCSATNTKNCTGGPFNLNHNWLPIAFEVIAICLLFNVLVWVAGHVLNLPHVVTYAQSEFFQVTASSLMIVGVVFILTAGFSYLVGVQVSAAGQPSGTTTVTSGSITGPPGLLPAGTTISCMGGGNFVQGNPQQGLFGLENTQNGLTGPMAVVQCKLQEKITYVQALYTLAWENNAVLEPEASACFNAMGIQVYCFDWNVELHAQVEQAHLLANKLVPLGIALAAQYQFVQYLANNMLAVFLPIGLLLRAVPFLRGLGALMIAMAIGFYIVFPVAYILLDPSTTKPPPTTLIPSVGSGLPACYATFSGMVSSLTTLTTAQNTQTTPLPTAAELAAQFAQLQVEGFFNPLVALACALIFISIATPLLGGDTGEIMHFLTKVI